MSQTGRGKVSPQITDLSVAVIKHDVAGGIVSSSLCHDSIYRSIDARCMHSISMDAIVMANQVTVPNESPAT